MKKNRFRAWNVKLQEMREVTAIDFWGEEISVAPNYKDTEDFIVWSMNECFTMQYIGEVDLRRQHIFEGDVLCVKEDGRCIYVVVPSLYEIITRGFEYDLKQSTVVGHTYDKGLLKRLGDI